MNISVRELQHSDIERITNYWLTSPDDYLIHMGVDLNRMLLREEWIAMLTEQLNTPIENKKSYAIIWEIDGEPIGHCNIGKIIPGEEAHMHLHMWQPHTRQKGIGVPLIKMTLPYFFNNYKLKNLFCEPHAHNAAPNKALSKAGFSLVKTYITTPGILNYEHETNRWLMTREAYEQMLLG